MRIVVIVDGDSEYYSLPSLYPQIYAESETTFVKTVKADLQPKATAKRIGLSCANAARPLISVAQPDLFVVLIDREDSLWCPGERASEIATEIRHRVSEPRFSVVIKDRCFENWLIADPSALTALRKRFSLSKKATAQIVPDRADRANALVVLKAASISGDFDKVQDSKRILNGAQVNEMGENSRSFRRFLRSIGYNQYLGQSAVPASKLPR